MTQKEALKILQSGDNVFLTGEPGAGKSYTINLFQEWAAERGRFPSITASTGIAATHIGGVTIHSWSGIGIKDKITDSDIRSILHKDYLADRIANAETLIIDEISMINGPTLDNIDLVIRKVRGQLVGPHCEGSPFGGLQIIFVGDFFQLPPVSRDTKNVKFAFESEAWLNAEPKICYLTEQHRQEDGLFLEILTAMRKGSLSVMHKKHLMARRRAEAPKNITRLFTHNSDVDLVNTSELAKISAPKKTFTMQASCAHAALKFMIDILKKSCLSPEILELKVGAPVMFTRNDSNKDGGGKYVNGTLGEVTGFDDNGAPIVTTKSGQKIYVSRQEWSIVEHGVTKASISQYPLRLAWAITVHKCQGMSLDAATMDLGRAFEYGQGYVALSRVRSLDGLYLEGINEKALQMHPTVVEKDGLFRKLSETNL